MIKGIFVITNRIWVSFFEVFSNSSSNVGPTLETE